MSLPELSLHEMISTANHSSSSVIFVEGKGDLETLRQFEDRTQLTRFVIRCGGRERLFKLLERRVELTRVDVAFLADQDRMCMFGGGISHPKLVYTWGYSIENDIVSGSKIDKLLLEEEVVSFSKLKKLAVRWYAYEIEAAASLGVGPLLDVSLESIIDPVIPCYRSHVQNREQIVAHSTALERKIQRSHKRLFRGKNLLQLYALVLNRVGRKARFHPNALVAVCLTQNKNSKINLLVKNLHLVLALDDLTTDQIP